MAGAEEQFDELLCERADEDEEVSYPAGFHYRGGSKLRVYRYISETSLGTVVLLHGLLASHGAWDGVAWTLRDAGWTTLAPDLLGFGESPWPRGADSYGINRHIERIVDDVLCGARGRPIHLVGHSLGGVLAAEIAARGDIPIASVTTFAIPYFASRAQATRTLRTSPVTCCCCCRPLFFGGGGGGDKKHQKGWRAAAVWLVLEWPVLAFILCSLICQQRKIWLLFARLLGGPALETRVAGALHHSYDSVLASYRNVVEAHRLRVTPELDQLPVLVAHGTHDDVIAPACSSRFFNALNRPRRRIDTTKPKRFVMMDGVKHSCGGDAAPAIANLLLWWLTAGSSGRPPPLPPRLEDNHCPRSPRRSPRRGKQRSPRSHGIELV